MNAKIITIWGANGSGKTTVAVNLAAAIAARNLMVCVISSKLYYGELQIMFGKRIESDKGIYKAISSGGNTRNLFEPAGNPNLFFLSAPNSFDGMLLTAVSADSVKEMLEDAAIRFDYLIIDGSEELNNPISSLGITMSNKIIRVYRVSTKDCVWYAAMDNLTDLMHIRSKTINVINGYDKSCDKMAFLNSSGIKPDFELPYIQAAATLSNSGKLIYDSRTVSGQYKKIIEKLAGQVIAGG